MKRVLKKLAPFWEYNPKKIAWPPRENYYEHYSLWASLVKPKSYLEIGVMYGWSAMAILAGWPHVERMVVIDSELYEIPVDDAVAQILSFRFSNEIKSPFKIDAFKRDTKKLSCLPVIEQFDLIHIDGEHSTEAVKHDLELALGSLADRGTIIVDDIRFDGVKAGADFFLHKHPEVTVRHVETHQGHYLIWRK